MFCCDGLIATYRVCRHLSFVCRHTFKDWISADIQQILIETHDLPLASEAKDTQHGMLPRMDASEYFDAFEENGFVLFSKEVNRCVHQIPLNLSGFCDDFS